jgi:polyprenyl synthetase
MSATERVRQTHAVRALGRDALTAARFPSDLLWRCETALSRPGRLFSSTPIASRLFLAWSGALLPRIPPAWLPAAVACEYVFVGCDLIDQHTDALFASNARGWHKAYGQIEQSKQAMRSAQIATFSAGVSLLLLAQELMSGLDTPEERRAPAARILSRMSRHALAAHHHDSILRTHEQRTIAPESVLTVLRWRSGELGALPCVCAAVLAGSTRRCIALARRFGRALGCGGQLEDDMVDRHEDIIAGRKTLPLLLTDLEAGDPALVEATTAVLTHRFLEEAAAAIRSLSSSALTLYDSEALWELLPGAVR